jgi:uncharacterized protein YraI
MRTRLGFLLALAFAACVPPAAAHTATTTDSVNVRAGPDKSFPTVTWILSGTSVTLEGCTADWRWCDVIAGRHRGWVYARFLSYPFNGSAVTVVRGGPNLGLPQIEFSLGPYWDAHYRDQRWYKQKADMQKRWDRRPPPREWRER